VADILDKAAQPCWAVCVRYAVATTATDRQSRLASGAEPTPWPLPSLCSQDETAWTVTAWPTRRLRSRARQFGRGDLVSVPELAALAHLPTDASVPGLARAGAKAVAPPQAVARATVAAGSTPVSVSATEPSTDTSTDTPKLLGDAQAGGRRAVALAVHDARHHLHVMGATGSGKSTLPDHLALSDISAGRGVVVIDPKGDLVTDICARLPEGAETRTVLIDPEEHWAPPVLNVLAGADPDLVVDNLVGIFRSIFAAFWGPRTDDVLRAACLTLLRSATEESPASLARCPAVFSPMTPSAPRARPW